MFLIPPKVHQWGYSDKQLFDFYLSQLETHKEPFIDVILTLSIHSPFDQAGEQEMQEIEKLIKTNFPNETFSEMDKKVLSNARYFDNCIKGLMDGLKKTKLYENTIVVITGDHNVQNLALRNEIDRYYVPLYIVSPLLNKYKNMGGVCSHLDIAPSLSQLLVNTYNVPMPDQVSYVGQGLDTSGTFNAERIFPLSVYSNNLAKYICRDLLLAGDRTYQIR